MTPTVMWLYYCMMSDRHFDFSLKRERSTEVALFEVTSGRDGKIQKVTRSNIRVKPDWEIL
jgi:hypothetical protein